MCPRRPVHVHGAQGVDARHNRTSPSTSSRCARAATSARPCVKDLERGSPRASATTSRCLNERTACRRIVEAKAAMNADVRVVIKVAPGYHTAEIPTGAVFPKGRTARPATSAYRRPAYPRRSVRRGVVL